MVALICFVLAVLALPFKSKSRLEAENAGAPTSADRFATQGERAGPAFEQRSLVLRPALSLVSVDPGGRHDPPSRDVGALASGRLSPLLALEIALTRRASANRDRTARADPADERGEFALGCAAHSRRTAQAWV